MGGLCFAICMFTYLRKKKNLELQYKMGIQDNRVQSNLKSLHL